MNNDRSEKKNRNVYIPLYEIDTRRAVPRASVAVWPRSKKKDGLNAMCQ